MSRSFGEQKSIMIDQILFWAVAVPFTVFLEQQKVNRALKRNTEAATETLRKICENEALVDGLHGPYNSEAADVLAVAIRHLAETRAKLIQWQSESEAHRSLNEPPWLCRVIIEDLSDLVKFQQKQK